MKAFRKIVAPGLLLISGAMLLDLQLSRGGTLPSHPKVLLPSWKIPDQERRSLVAQPPSGIAPRQSDFVAVRFPELVLTPKQQVARRSGLLTGSPEIPNPRGWLTDKDWAAVSLTIDEGLVADPAAVPDALWYMLVDRFAGDVAGQKEAVEGARVMKADWFESRDRASDRLRYFPTNGKLIVLLPECSAEAAKDHLAHLADLYTRVFRKRPSGIVRLYYRGSGSRTELFDSGTIPEERLFSADFGWKEVEVRGAEDRARVPGSLDAVSGVRVAAPNRTAPDESEPAEIYHFGGRTLRNRLHAAMPVANAVAMHARETLEWHWSNRFQNELKGQPATKRLIERSREASERGTRFREDLAKFLATPAGGRPDYSTIRDDELRDRLREYIRGRDYTGRSDPTILKPPPPGPDLMEAHSREVGESARESAAARRVIERTFREELPSLRISLEAPPEAVPMWRAVRGVKVSP